MCMKSVSLFIIHAYQVERSQSIAQSILLYEGLYRFKSLLDHMAIGLKACNILKCMQSFPTLYIPLFMHTGDVNSDDAIYCEPEHAADVALAHLYRFIRESDTNRELMLICIST